MGAHPGFLKGIDTGVYGFWLGGCVLFDISVCWTLSPVRTGECLAELILFHQTLFCDFAFVVFGVTPGGD